MELVPMRIAHSRNRPRRNAFAYDVCYFAIPVAQWTRGTRSCFFSIDRPNLFSLQSRDYGDSARPPSQWIAETFAAHGIATDQAHIVLLTLPRLMGYAFNPVSFWLCFDEGLRAVLCEVNNTFGERHCYLCSHDDHRPIRDGEPLVVRKAFHVSPFLDVAGSYRFGFACDGARIAIRIDLVDEEGVLLATSMRGDAVPMTPGALLRAAISYPLQTLKLVARIYHQALRLRLKGVRRHHKPPPPAEFVSR
jgi:DUF1365 family protein